MFIYMDFYVLIWCVASHVNNEAGGNNWLNQISAQRKNSIMALDL